MAKIFFSSKESAEIEEESEPAIIRVLLAWPFIISKKIMMIHEIIKILLIF